MTPREPDPQARAAIAEAHLERVAVALNLPQTSDPTAIAVEILKRRHVTEQLEAQLREREDRLRKAEGERDEARERLRASEMRAESWRVKAIELSCESAKAHGSVVEERDQLRDLLVEEQQLRSRWASRALAAERKLEGPSPVAAQHWNHRPHHARELAKISEHLHAQVAAERAELLEVVRTWVREERARLTLAQCLERESLRHAMQVVADIDMREGAR